MRAATCAILAIAISVATANGTSAQSVTLKLADTLPAGHTMHQEITQVFIAETRRLSGGAIGLDHFPGGQLGKPADSLRLIQTGLQDIGLLAPSLVSDKMPYSSVTELPGLWSRSCELMKAAWPLFQENGTLFKLDFAPNGIRPLILLGLPQYVIGFATSREVKALKDLSGLRIRSVGGALDGLVAKLGGSPVRLAAPEIYEALNRGTADGAIMGNQGITGYKMEGLLKTVLTGQNLGTVFNVYAISDAKWRSLSDAGRAALAAAGENATMAGCAGLDRVEDDTIAKVKAAGAKYIVFDAADNERMATLFAEVRKGWAADLDKRGRPGTDVLGTFETALKSGR